MLQSNTQHDKTVQFYRILRTKISVKVTHSILSQPFLFSSTDEEIFLRKKEPEPLYRTRLPLQKPTPYL